MFASKAKTSLTLSKEKQTHLASVLSQVANGRQMPSSFGMVNPLVNPTRDRAARLRSSDVPWIVKGIPDAKDQDVVAIQLRLF
jgi:hypothetical protein